MARDAPAKRTLAVHGAPFEISTYRGPAYLVKGNEPVVVGLLTGSNDGKGFIIPIHHLASAR